MYEGQKLRQNGCTYVAHTDTGGAQYVLRTRNNRVNHKVSSSLYAINTRIDTDTGCTGDLVDG